MPPDPFSNIGLCYKLLLVKGLSLIVFIKEIPALILKEKHRNDFR